MSIGKYISLEEARKKGLLDRFIREHPSEGNMDRVLDSLDRIAKNKPVKKPLKGRRTSGGE